MVNRLSWTHNLQHQPNPTVALWGFCELHFRQNTSHYISWHCTTLLYCVMRSVHFLRSTLTCEFHQCTTLHISSRICDIWKVRKCVTCDKIELEILAKLRAANPWKCVCEGSILLLKWRVALRRSNRTKICWLHPPRLRGNHFHPVQLDSLQKCAKYAKFWERKICTNMLTAHNTNHQGLEKPSCSTGFSAKMCKVCKNLGDKCAKLCKRLRGYHFDCVQLYSLQSRK